MNNHEIEVPVPWGHLAAKAWGDEKNPIVLVFHGIFDNAGSFDRLIPLLPPQFYYICFDLPGHGQSSHFPPYLPIYTDSILLAYKIIVKHFKQERYIIMGHSYGAQLAVLFTQLWPSYVEKLIMLDALRFLPIPPKYFKQYVVERYEFILDLNEKHKTRSAPSYTFEEALQKVIDSRYHGYLTPESAEPMVRRGLKPDGNGKFYFTADQRLKQFINPLHDLDYAVKTLNAYPVTCPTLIILAKESEMQALIMKPIINVMKNKGNCIIKYVDGDHDVHNNTPEVVEPHITKFLLKKNAKL